MTRSAALLLSVLGFALGLNAQGVVLSLNHDNAGLGLATTDLQSQDYTMVGANGTTTDGYASGVADLDCFGERFFYVLANPYKLVTLDAVTGALQGSVSIDNPLDADVPATNIAYDWTDDTLYGLAHWYSGGTNVQLIAIDPATGDVEVVGNGPSNGSTYGSGNCDIDALGNRYFLFGGGRLKVWDTDSGDMITNANLPTLFGNANLESWSHPMYHPVEDRIYCLHLLQPENYNWYGPLYQTEIRLARLHPETAEVEWYTEGAISMDGIQSGVCDLDPFSNRIFYQRVDGLKVFGTDGTSLGTISSPSGSISPWANVQYHDLSTEPTAIVGTEGDATVIEWDGVSFLSLQNNLGEAIDFDGWTGPDGTPAMSSEWTVTDYGTVHIHGHRTGDSGRTIDVQHTFSIVPTTVNGISETPGSLCTLFSRPWTAYNTQGQIVLESSETDLDSDPRAGLLSSGLHIIRMEGCPSRTLWVR